MARNLWYKAWYQNLNRTSLNHYLKQNLRKRGPEKGPIDIAAFLLGFKYILASRAIRLDKDFTLTLAILRLSLVPTGSMFCFSQSKRGHWPKAPERNFSRMVYSPLGVWMYRAWTRPYKFILDKGCTLIHAILETSHFRNPLPSAFNQIIKNSKQVCFKGLLIIVEVVFKSVSIEGVPEVIRLDFTKVIMII